MRRRNYGVLLHAGGIATWLGAILLHFGPYFPAEGDDGPGFVVLLQDPESCCVSERMLPQSAAGSGRGEAIMFQEKRV